MSEVIDAGTIRAWTSNMLAGLGRARTEIDALNVFPVPDGDTGTNLYLTIEAAAQAVQDVLPDPLPQGFDVPPVAEVVKTLSHGSLIGARGNSGVITSQILRGMSDEISAHADGEELGPTVLANALRRSADLAYAAVDKPKEGTILSVARAAAAGAQTAVEAGADLTGVASLALDGAQDALAKTTEQLQQLKDAGVVDAGGQGLVVILNALVEAITGVRAIVDTNVGLPLSVPIESHTVYYGGPAYEVMFLLDGKDELVPHMKQKLSALGDSLVVVGGDGLWNVHVHVDDIGSAIEAGVEAGRPYRIKVTHLEEVEGSKGSGSDSRSIKRKGRALVAVAHGPGVAELLIEAGVTVVRAQPDRRPSTGELLEGISRSAANEVVVLPSDGDTRVVAEAAAGQAREQGIRVVVIPSRAVVQTLAAVAVHDPAANFDDDLVSMGRASASTRYGAVTVAIKEAVTTAGVCRIGDVLGLVDGDIVEIGETVDAVATRVLDRMLNNGGELVTIVTGADATDVEVDAIADEVDDVHPEVDVDIVRGGQLYWPFIFGVE